ncbi:hypothetical protein K9L97_05225 [Candidatus Woesearchaeota archaeon]|nr:hypothetical protein [Candidatus Woesearchaeota archaeon]
MNTKKILIIIIIILATHTTLTENTNTQNQKFLDEKNATIEIYFCPKDNCEQKIIQEIQTAKKIKCAFYDLTENKIITTLKEKNAEILIDEDNYENYGTKIKKTGLMHNKFCTLDEKTTITGSYNPTQNNTNDNNILIIKSEYINKIYKKEHEEIKKQTQQQKTTNNKINMNGTKIQIYLCPEDQCQTKIQNELKKANKTIHFLTFTFTDKEIAQTLIDKHKEGLEVKGIIEKFQNHKISTFQMIKESGINVTYDKNPKMQHNKIFIIDNKTTITGSYNPTKAANTINDENIIIIENKEIAEKYVAYFEYLNSNKTY